TGREDEPTGYHGIADPGTKSGAHGIGAHYRRDGRRSDDAHKENTRRDADGSPVQCRSRHDGEDHEDDADRDVARTVEQREEAVAQGRLRAREDETGAGGDDHGLQEAGDLGRVAAQQYERDLEPGDAESL